MCGRAGGQKKNRKEKRNCPYKKGAGIIIIIIIIVWKNSCTQANFDYTIMRIEYKKKEEYNVYIITSGALMALQGLAREGY